MNDEPRYLGATPERLRRAGDNIETFTPDENINHRAIRLLDGHVLDFLRSRGTITGEEYVAGTRFYADWYYGGLSNSGVIDPGRVVVDGGQIDHTSERQMEALTNFNQAIKAIGKTNGEVLTDILIAEEKLEEWARRVLGRHKSDKHGRIAATACLRLALMALDIHYHGRRHVRTRSSHAPDYKPVISPGEINEVDTGTRK